MELSAALGLNHGSHARSRSVRRGHTHRPIALLLRGEAFRWGCDEVGVALQREVARAYEIMLAAPLQALGSSVALFLAPNGNRCADLERSAGEVALARLAQLFNQTGRVSMVGHAQAYSQAENMLYALGFFFRATHHLRYRETKMIIARLDVQFHIEPTRWLCDVVHSQKLSLASKCSWGWDHPWPDIRSDRCSSDIMHIVPRRYYSHFAAAMGSTCECFNSTTSAPPCPTNKNHNGHRCYDAFSTLIGEDNIEFCWPPFRSHVFAGPALLQGSRQYDKPQPFYSKPHRDQPRYQVTLATSPLSKAWLLAAQSGNCGVTRDVDKCHSNSSSATKGAFTLPRLVFLRGLAHATERCLELCRRCVRCKFMTVSSSSFDCSWYASCPELYSYGNFYSAPVPEARTADWTQQQASNATAWVPRARWEGWQGRRASHSSGLATS